MRGGAAAAVSKIIDQPGHRPTPNTPNLSSSATNLCLTRVPSLAHGPNWFPGLIIQLSPLQQGSALKSPSDGLIRQTIDGNDEG